MKKTNYYTRKQATKVEKVVLYAKLLGLKINDWGVCVPSSCVIKLCKEETNKTRKTEQLPKIKFFHSVYT